jgi:signal transduction histidine kinase
VDKKLKVMADTHWLQAILTNLLDNAVKYSREGGEIGIGAKYNRNTGMVIISVTDQGAGIPAGKQKNIFEPFERAGKYREKGLGLGLYIVKKLIEMQKGAIRVESKAGRGSTFSLSLPGSH